MKGESFSQSLTKRRSHSPLIQATEFSEEGLSQREVDKRFAQYGANRLPEPKMHGPFELFVRQFLNPFIYILFIAAILSFALGQTPSGVFIILVLLLNAMVGTVQEYSAQRSAAALRNMVRGMTHVVRNGVARSVEIEELVPGDLVCFPPGTRCPPTQCWLALRIYPWMNRC